MCSLICASISHATWCLGAKVQFLYCRTKDDFAKFAFWQVHTRPVKVLVGHCSMRVTFDSIRCVIASTAMNEANVMRTELQLLTVVLGQSAPWNCSSASWRCFKPSTRHTEAAAVSAPESNSGTHRVLPFLSKGGIYLPWFFFHVHVQSILISAVGLFYFECALSIRKVASASWINRHVKIRL